MPCDRIFAVVWTPSHHRVVPTKKRGEEKLKVWKRWYERQGWKVYRVGDGFVASYGNEGHPVHRPQAAIQLHAYDVCSKVRVPLVKSKKPSLATSEKPSLVVGNRPKPVCRIARIAP